MTKQRATLADYAAQVSVTLSAVSARFENGDVVADELRTCSRMLTALAEALMLYADRMPEPEQIGRHARREAPES
jgi:hypothetical protein